MMDPKRFVYVVEDDASFQKSLSRLVRVWGYEVQSFNRAEDFLALNVIRRPSCLLLDVKLPTLTGLDLQEKLIEKGSRLPTIFMTGHGTIPMGVQAMKRGAVDFLPKPFDSKELRAVIDRAIERDIAQMDHESQVENVRSSLKSLTSRETEVLRWIITGKLNKQIAQALGISEKTVRTHRGRVMHKSKASSVAELVRLAEKVDIQPAAN